MNDSGIKTQVTITDQCNKNKNLRHENSGQSDDK